MSNDTINEDPPKLELKEWQKKNLYKFINIFHEESVKYRQYVQKKLNDFLKLDVGFFALIQVFYDKEAGLWSTIVTFTLFVIGFLMKIVMISLKLIEWSQINDEFLQKSEKGDYKIAIMRELYHGRKMDDYHKEFEYYKKLIKPVNISIFFSQFGIVMILISKFVYNLEEITTDKFVIDLIIAIGIVITSMIITLVIIFRKMESLGKKNGKKGK